MKHDDYKHEFTVKRKNDVILITNNLNSVINTIRPGYIDDNEKYIGEMENKLMTLEFSAKSDNAQIRKLLKENQKLKVDNESNKIKIEELQNENKRFNAIINRLEKEKENITLGINSHNTRGAGRKPKITDEQITLILMYRSQGKKLKDIATELDLSYGSVQNISKKYTRLEDIPKVNY